LSVGTDTVTEISVLLTYDDPSKVGTSVEISYMVLGAYASSVNDYCRLFVIVDRFVVLLKEVGILHAKTF
jgi:hypothetical protein